jgi:hypothetical protein
MALPRKTKKIESIPEAARALYKSNGKEGDELEFTLQDDFLPEGMVDKTKVDEFRANNVNLLKEKQALEAQAAQFSGLNLDEVKELLRKKQELEDEKLIKAGDVETLVANRTKKMAEDHSAKLQEALDAQAASQARLEDLEINEKVRHFAAKKEVLTGAMEPVLLMAKQIFRHEGGKVVPMKDGEIWYDASGEPMSIENWVDRLSVEASYLFKQSSGSGASNQSSGRTADLQGGNPYKKGATFNLTKQGLLEQSQPQLAKQLRAEAENA